MGLLDDAIRQHLDLKRRHGAHPSDVAKLEREAFGPSELAEPAGMPEAADAAAYETTRQAVPVYDDAEQDGEEEWTASVPPVASAPEVIVPPEPAVEPRRAAPIEPAAVEPAAPAVAPAPEQEPEPLRPGGSVPLDEVGERTIEHSTPAREPDLTREPDPQPDAEPGERDELEETPEFLQETPEHDRLWFEQKPPRDFEF